MLKTDPVLIKIGEPFRIGSAVSAAGEADLASAIEQLNKQLKDLGSHARVNAMYMDSGAMLALSVVDSLDF